MNRHLLLTLAMAMAFNTPEVEAQQQWAPAGDHIRTQWADELNPSCPLPEYPRPIMVRDEWMNLNGLWNYSILPVGETPSSYEGKILVPFAAESSLSGVGKAVGKDNNLWYSREFSVPKSWSGKNVILHFGAVDWKADIWVNDIKVGSHTGGYAPFEMDITDALAKGPNTLKVKVWDPGDDGWQPRGKQVNNPSGIWYTSVTGIWQTVWMEPVSENHITAVRTTPDLDAGVFKVLAQGPSDGIVTVSILSDGKTVAVSRAIAGQEVELAVANPHLWTPDDPFLYDMEITLTVNGKTVDNVRSYTAMRKFSTTERKVGDVMRLTLNNKPIFHMGPLDQGWWPDGLYTAPTDEALAYDIKKTKELGFNMIRKHVKVEPARWYYWCDKLGIIVWQDMPSGDHTPFWTQFDYCTRPEFSRSAESEANWRREWKEIMDYLYSQPCVGVWVPFNEAWGQFKTKEIALWTKTYDPTRSVNPASGGNYFVDCGDILDLHKYPAPELYLRDANRVTVMGEFGGIGNPISGHLWKESKDGKKAGNWGYISFESINAVTDQYIKYAEMLYDLIPVGISAGVYTQTTDVEVEVNGLMTYDRKIDKVDVERIHDINSKLCHSLDD